MSEQHGKQSYTSVQIYKIQAHLTGYTLHNTQANVLNMVRGFDTMNNSAG